VFVKLGTLACLLQLDQGRVAACVVMYVDAST